MDYSSRLMLLERSISQTRTAAASYFRKLSKADAEQLDIDCEVLRTLIHNFPSTDESHAEGYSAGYGDGYETGRRDSSDMILAEAQMKIDAVRSQEYAKGMADGVEASKLAEEMTEFKEVASELAAALRPFALREEIFDKDLDNATAVFHKFIKSYPELIK